SAAQNIDAAVTTGSNYKPRVAINTQGQAFVTWLNFEVSPSTVSAWVARFDRASKAWQAAVPVAITPANSEGKVIMEYDPPQVAVDAYGNAVVAWAQTLGLIGGGIEVGLWSRRYAASTGIWTAPVRLDSLDARHYYWSGIPFRLAVYNQTVTAVWSQVRLFQQVQQAWSNEYDLTTDRWGQAAPLVPSDRVSSFVSDFAVNSSGNSVVTWWNSTGAWVSQRHRPTLAPKVQGMYSVSPGTGTFLMTVMVFGQGFENGMQVTVNGAPVSLVQVMDSNWAFVFVPATTTGTLCINTSAGNTCSSTPLGAPPASSLSIKAFWPRTAKVGDMVFVSGSGFVTGSGKTTVQINGVAAPIVQVMSSDLLFVMVPPGATSGPIGVRDTASNSLVISTDALTIAGPNLVAVSMISTVSVSAEDSLAMVALGVDNNGTARAEASQLAFRLSKNRVFGDADDIWLPANQTLTALLPAQRDNREYMVALPASLPAGKYYLCAQVNADGRIKETQTNDNTVCSTNPIRVSPRLS
ncbi:MAG: IPT/TIG domain-containing protein, partial [Planctomycetota bacterium]